MYGCEFVGMAEVLSFVFDAYDYKLGEKNQVKLTMPDIEGISVHVWI